MQENPDGEEEPPPGLLAEIDREILGSQGSGVRESGPSCSEEKRAPDRPSPALDFAAAKAQHGRTLSDPEKKRCRFEEEEEDDLRADKRQAVQVPVAPTARATALRGPRWRRGLKERPRTRSQATREARCPPPACP